MATRYLSPRDVAVIHFMVMKKYGEGEQAGIKDQGLLESAVYRPQQTVFVKRLTQPYLKRQLLCSNR
ncbi:hypothetical protein [Caldalkalibacillus thermarum]|uniref:hypothetical protein n=1 Tax=Caldalkalibacillus thermarum TaxID=296745 RepID=UPI00280C3062|nr:hypothetical protein [Caldalkalibacillus thermarum]